MIFFDRLASRIDDTDSIVCVGLDPDLDRLPDVVMDAGLPRWAFNRRIIDATHEHVAAYKPNIAFYEDPAGWQSLAETIAYAAGKDVPIILDAKRADIGNTARQYSKLLDPEAYGLTSAAPDAITLNPFLGEDALAPFLDRPDKGVFILCRTSNPGGGDIQNLVTEQGDTVYERVATLAASWNRHDNVGLVVGATVPDELETIRERVPDLPFLVPGVGAQGGDVEAAVTYGTANGVGLVNSSRGILFADPTGSAQFANAARSAVKQLQRNLSQYTL